jgi:peroxiredoxin
MTPMRLLFSLFSILFVTTSFAQQGSWVAQIHRTDGNNIVFTFDWKTEKGKPVWYIKNGGEKIRVANILQTGDSFIVQMPVFESNFRIAIVNKNIRGVWIKRGTVKTYALAFTAIPGTERFTTNGLADKNISGRWSVTFGKGKNTEASIAEFVQKGNHITGTFLTATGDYRYQEGIVTKDSVLLSGFDGGNAYFFKAHIDNANTISDGVFYSGGTSHEEWAAVKNNTAKLSTESAAMFVKPGQEKLNFTFKNLEGQPVSINDDRFKNKVVIIQLMGSWCPNCMDETAFLSDYYNKNKQRGIEIIALAYEYTTDWERSIRSLKKFQKRFNIQYTILNTEVTVGDSLHTEKTLPQVTPIKTFPSTIIIDKKGKIRKLDTEFNGPATGAHYIVYKKKFEHTVDELLQEN